MGRNAKLRSRRCTEQERLKQRHINQRVQLANNVISLGQIEAADATRCAVKMLRNQGLNLEMATTEAVPSVTPKTADPNSVTKAFGFVYGSIITGSYGSLDERMRTAFKEAAQLGEELFGSWLEWQGALLLRQVANHDWQRLRNNLVTVTQAPALQEAVRVFSCGHHEDRSVFGRDVIRLIQGSLLGWPATVNQGVINGDLSSFDAAMIFKQVQLLGDHLDNISDVANGRVLCDAGRLVLHYRYAKRQRDAELCLSHRHPDGLLTFHPDASEALPVRAVKQLRDFVDSYGGATMAGELSAHPNAQRLCRLIGLSVRHGHGFLEAASETTLES